MALEQSPEVSIVFAVYLRMERWLLIVLLGCNPPKVSTFCLIECDTSDATIL